MLEFHRLYISFPEYIKGNCYFRYLVGLLFPYIKLNNFFSAIHLLMS